MENLKKLRKQRDLTQEELAKLLNISRTTYVGYERKTSEPNLEFLFKLADFYDVSLDYLCGRQNNNLVYVDSLTELQKQLVSTIKDMSQEQCMLLDAYAQGLIKGEQERREKIERFRKGV